MVCAAGETTCAGTGGAANFCADIQNDRNNCGACGTVCAGNQDCAGGACVACTPSVTTDGNAPAKRPAGTSVFCVSGPNSTTGVICPVVKCGTSTFWAFSYYDNRLAFDVVGYDPAGNIVKQQQASGARYLWKISLDGTAKTSTFWGQDSRTASLPWTFFQ